MKKTLVLLVCLIATGAFAATLPTYKTTVLTPATGTTPDAYNTGAEITQYFTYTPVGTETNAKYVAVARIPAGSRLIDGELNFGATGVATTNTLGIVAVDGSGFYSLDGSTDADDSDGLLTAFATIALVKDTFVNLVAGDLLAGKVVEKDVYIVIDTTSTLALPVSKVIKGVVRYIR